MPNKSWTRGWSRSRRRGRRRGKRWGRRRGMSRGRSRGRCKGRSMGRSRGQGRSRRYPTSCIAMFFSFLVIRKPPGSFFPLTTIPSFRRVHRCLHQTFQSEADQLCPLLCPLRENMFGYLVPSRGGMVVTGSPASRAPATTAGPGHNNYLY